MAFGLNQTWLKEGNGYIYSKVSDKEKEKLEFYNKLYEEGLLDQQYLTKQWDTKEKAFYDGETAVIAKGEDQGFTATDITKESRGLAISSQSKHKDAAFEVLDYLASDKGQLLDRIGFEGEHYNVTDSGIELTDKYYSEWYARFWEPAEFNTEKPLKTPLLSEPAQKSRDLANEFYKEDNSFILPEQYISNWDAMENLYKEYATDIITGKRPVTDFDKFVDEWNQAGGKEITNYANENIK
ncbi:Bacterial extracellular solute-binding protein [Mycobacteroides abscessus subsp. abscessus]|nr:Bacterial extracellular solute-binding protein [Mycobacteroides abscessus subsp. abscessus]